MTPPQAGAKKRILLTNPASERSEGLDACRKRLRDWGAEVCHIPLIQIQAVPFQLPSPAQFEWLFFTSGNAVRTFYDKALATESSWAQLPTSAVGSATAWELRQFGIEPKHIPPRFDAESVAQEFIQTYNGTPLQALWPCGNLAEPKLPQLLGQAGIQVTPLITYETQERPLSAEEQAQLKSEFDLLVFASPSAIKAYQKLSPNLPETTHIACIGPTTAQAAKKTLGRCDIQAGIHTLEGLTDSIIQFYGEGLNDTQSRD
jgi:uroporphyrinogen-III synthase